MQRKKLLYKKARTLKNSDKITKNDVQKYRNERKLYKNFRNINNTVDASSFNW